MTTDTVVFVSPFQRKLKQFCIWIETKFECRIRRAVFAGRMALVAALFGALHVLRAHGVLDAHWSLGLAAGLLSGLAAFWTILQVVRRLHDLGRTGGLFWAVAIPLWAAGRIAALFHLAEKGLAAWWGGVLLLLFCAWSLKLIAQLFFRRGTDGPNGYDGRDFYQNGEIR